MKRSRATSKVSKPKRLKITIPDYQKGRELNKTPKSELKAFDIAEIASVFKLVGTPPTFNTLNAQINGAELYQRVGRKTYMKSLHIRGYISNIITTTQDMGRIIIYYDSQPNAAAPLITDLLQDSNAAAGTTAFSEINLINRQRFKILRDYQVLLPSVTNTAGVLTNLTIMDPIKESFNIDFFIKLKGLETIYNATNGGTVADITSGAIGMVCVCASNNSDWAFTWTSRLRYYD